MDFKKHIKICLSKYTVFSGRASRSEFWYFVLFTFIGGLIATVVDIMIFNYSWELNGPVYIIFEILILIPSISVAARRLHDIDKSGWWQLIVITIIGIIFLIFWFAQKGTKKKNKYGKPIRL
jgi:uncharacterized membrane protein YhaH (DUF805 family)